ncbi:MAG: 3-methyl-2-oxobutanoate hydroxymethyltransferase [Chloroflexota bacterium]
MRTTINQVQDMKRRGERIAMLTAYDYPSARFVEAAGVPMILVGDSLGMVVLGYTSTIPVTMDDMVHHVKAVVRGTQKAMVVADLPFLSYQASADDAVRNAGRMLQEAGAQAVKLEGGEPMAATVRRLTQVGIPVQRHIGLTPQSVNQFGGYRVQGKTVSAAAQLVRDAEALQAAGAFSVVLEGVPAELAALITQRLTIPTIGIGAGPQCDGQVQVFHDMLGYYPDFTPRHAKQYARLGDVIKEAVASYIAEVAGGSFPGTEHSISMSAGTLAALKAELAGFEG